MFLLCFFKLIVKTTLLKKADRVLHRVLIYLSVLHLMSKQDIQTYIQKSLFPDASQMS